MSQKFVIEQSIKFFFVDEVPDLYCAFSVQQTAKGEEQFVNINLHVNIPVEGVGIVHQVLPFNKEQIHELNNELNKWINSDVFNDS